MANIAGGGGGTGTIKKPPVTPETQQRKEQLHWMDAQNEHLRMARLENPALMRRAYENFWSAGAPDASATKYRQTAIDRSQKYHEFKDEYVPLWEDAWIKHKGEIPVQFFLQFDKNDLEFFRNTMSEDVAQDLYYAWASEAQDQAVRRAIDAEVDKRVTEREAPQRQLWSTADFPDVKLSAAEKDLIRSRVEKEFYEPAPAVEDTFWTHLNRVAPLFMGPVGWIGMGKGMTGTEIVGFSMDTMFSVAAPVLGMAQDSHERGNYNLIGDIMQWREATLEEQRQRDMAEVQAATGYSKEYAYQQVWNDSEQMWNEMGQSEKEFWIDIANGNEVQAMGLFISDRQDDPEIQEQLAQYSTDYDEDLRESVRTLQETEFSDKDKLLDGLAAWGNFTGDLAVGTLLLFGPTGPLGDGFNSYFDEIKKYEHSPAKFMGWEGTALGIAFDFGMMTLFDPTTYMFGGGAASAAGRGVARTQTGAMKILRSAEQVAKRTEIAKVMMSPGRSLSSLVTMSGLDNIGMSQLLGLADVVKPVFSRGDDLWRKAFPQADEVLTEQLAGLIPAQHTVDPKAATKAINSRGGFNRPITVEVGTSGAVRVADADLPALVAAVNNNWNVVPTQVRYLDDAVPGYTPDEVAKMRQVQELEPTTDYLGTSTVEASLRSWQETAVPSIDTQLGSITINGEEFGVYSAARASNTAAVLGGGHKKMWYVANQQRLIAGYDGYVMAVDNAYRGQGVMSQALKVAEDAGDSFLPRLLDRATGTGAKGKGMISFTEDAAKFTRREVGTRLEGKSFLDEGASKIDEVWGGAARIPDDLPTGPVKPATLLDDSRLFGETELSAQIEKIYQGQLLRNGRLEDMGYSAIARGFQSVVKRVTGMTDNDYVNYVTRYLTPRNLNRVFSTRSSHAVEDGIDYLMRMWGDDADGLNAALSKIVDRQRGVASKSTVLRTQGKRLNELDNQIEALKEQVGIVPDIQDDATREVMKDMMEARKTLQVQLQSLQEEAAALRAAGAKTRATLPDQTDIFKIIDDSIEEYIKKYLVPMKQWKPYVVDGTIPRHVLRKGINEGTDLKRGAGRTTTGFADETAESFDNLDDITTKELNRELKKISTTAPDNYDMGVSPIDLAVAREMGGANYMKWTQRKIGNGIRESGHAIQNWWMIDKVMRPATAAVVTIDEAMRIIHLYGMPALQRYMQDKILFTEARTMAVLKGKNPLGREAVSVGASSLSAKGQERIRRLQDWGAKLRADERTFFDQHGIGYVDIDVADPLYRTYAQQWTTQFTNDSGFRAYLEGPEEFGKWWDTSADAARLRDRTINVKKGAVPPTKDQVFEGWNTMWKVLSSEADKAGKGTEFHTAWQTATREITSTGKPVPLPDSIYDNFIPVRGAQKIGGGPVRHFTEAFFDRFFMDPVNYRRGFIAEMVRQTEMKRLRQFYATQGKKIVPDSMLDDVMNISGYRTSVDMGTPEALAHVWADSDFVPESYVHSVIERTVEKEIENVLYVWNMSSRAGAQSKLAFPFGKPYADMMGFWGREILKTPILRGYLNNDNFLNMTKLANAIPFNPKTGAMISRMAATNFEVNRGWIPEEGDMGEGLFPGSSSTDLSPMFFLPTEGDDILGSTLPGLGFIPLAFLDMVLNVLGPDPVKEPIEYWKWVDNISETLPYFEYQSGGMLSRVAGGGTMATMFSAAVDAQGYFGGKTYFNVTSELGDIGREIRRAREVSVLLSDPDVLAELDAIEDPELLEQYVMGIVSDANQAASLTHFGETMGRWGFPAKTKWDATGAELQEVWITAAGEFPDILDVEPEMSLDTQEGKRQYAADIRNRFFDLSGWERDLLIASHPSLAVNMVSSWDWTPKAVDAAVPGSGLPYATGGTPADMLRHDYYVNNGFVRPIQPVERAKLIIGQVAEARDNTVKQLYTFVTQDINDVVWEAVEASPGGLEFFENIQAELGERFGTKDARHVWENWSTLEPLIADIMESEQGHVFEEGESRTLGVPEDMKPWSQTWPGYEQASQKFSDIQEIPLSEDAQRIVDLMDMDYSPNMTGEQFHRMVADKLAQNDTLAHGRYRPSWDQFTQERLAFSNSSSAQLTKAKYNPSNAPEWRKGLIEWDVRVQNLMEQYADAPQGIPTQIRQKVIEEYGSFIAGSKDDGTIPWDTIWEGAYQPVFGPLDWVPPEPLPPFQENGEKTPTTRVPIVHTVVDGDTLLVSEVHDRTPYAVRLLGVSADEYGYDPDAAEADSKRLRDAIERARQNGDRIYLVTDPDRFVNHTDRYGRMLAWLWIGDEPFYFEEEMNPRFTPSGAQK